MAACTATSYGLFLLSYYNNHCLPKDHNPLPAIIRTKKPFNQICS